jgi:hypothetical protein
LSEPEPYIGCSGLEEEEELVTLTKLINVLNAVISFVKVLASGDIAGMSA